MMRFAIIAIVLFLLLAILYTTTDVNNTGLKFLSWIKKIQGNSVNLSNMNHNNSKIINHSDWDNLLINYVDVSGRVDYKGFIKDKEKLDLYLDTLSLNPPQNSNSKDYKLAYWINAYNAYTVKLILDHYPLESIKDISKRLVMIDSPWDIKFFKIGGVDMDLNTIEHEILRKEFDDPRIHFAINCASISCPKLLNQAFLPEQLNDQLERQAIDFINNPSKNLINETALEISKIFSWFKVDFKDSGGVKAFIQRYIKVNIETATISYNEYNWRLNN